MTKLEYLFLIYMYDNGRTIYLIMGGLGEWRCVVHHVLCKANCRGVKDVEATRGALPVT